MSADSLSSSDNLGRLECGCRISLVVGVDKPYGTIAWCATHEKAQAMRQTLNLLRGYTAGAEERVKELGIIPKRAIADFRRIRGFIEHALPKSDLPGLVPVVEGPGEEGS